MQKENEVIKIQVILNLIQDLQRLPLQLVNNMRGRSRIKYGMTALYTNSAFTLIELLVVVLIIGILAAVALPQYQLAVEKARAVEAITVLNSVQKAIDVYVLEHGIEDHLEFLGNNVNSHGQLDIDIENSLDCTYQQGTACTSKDYVYYASCKDTCTISADRGDYNDSSFEYELLLGQNSAITGTWEKYCYYVSSKGKKLCDSLQTQGWTNEAF